jgi:peptide/nickel transport system substrate-binding protein
MKTIRCIITIFLAFGLVLAGCNAQPAAETAATDAGEATQPPTQGEVVSPDTTGPKTGGNLVWATQQEPDTLDWHKSGLLASYNVDYYISAALMELTPDDQLVPWLAESYTVSEDGLNYDFTLRTDVKFSDGSPLTAKDYVWTFNRALNPDTASPVAASYLGPVKEVVETGPNSFRITLTSAFAPLLFNLADPGYTGPMSEAAFNTMGEEAFGRSPVGVGPFKVKEWKTGERIILDRNPEYKWGSAATKNTGPAYIETIEFRIIAEYSTIVAGLQAGEIQFAKLQTKDVENIQSLGKYQLFSQPAKGMFPFLTLNVSKPPFNDIKVRQAFNQAINRQALIDVVLLGKGEKQFGPLSPPQVGYWDGAKDIGYDYDLDKAKQLVQDAGYTLNSNNILEKDGTPFALTAIVFSGNERNIKTIQVIQQQLKDLGIDLSIEQVEPGIAFQRLMDGDYELCIVGLTSPEADILYLQFHSQGGLNLGHTSDPELDTLLEKSRTTTDPAQRQAVLNDVQKMIIEKAYVVPLYIPQDFYTLDNAVQGSRLLFFDLPNLVDAYYK